MSCDIVERPANRWPGQFVSIARRRFVVLRPALVTDTTTSHKQVSIARRRFVVLRRWTPRSLLISSFVSIARRRFVVLRLAHAGLFRQEPLWNNGFQSPAGDSLSCDQLSTPPDADGRSVSIARRRFVVLRRRLPPLIGRATPIRRFNRPQAIRCLATRTGQGLVAHGVVEFQSPAGDSLSCDSKGYTEAPDRAILSFNRPQAIRCLATLAPSDAWSSTQPRGFNRPQAIRCLATKTMTGGCWTTISVSIARRRFVVLRPFSRIHAAHPRTRGFNRPQAIRCLATDGRGRAKPGIWFQSPAGDSLSCDGWQEVLGPTRKIRFQSPAGDSLSCDFEIGRITSRRRGDVSIARRRFVVLRHAVSRRWCNEDFCFNRPQAIRCLATTRPAPAPFEETFQSPAGDSLSCDERCRPRWVGPIEDGFQSPAGDSLSCDFRLDRRELNR